MKTEITDLKTKGFVSIEYPKDLREAVEQSVLLWKEFCELPREVKEDLPCSSNADGVGYEIKEGVGNKADRKENFDISLRGSDWIESHLKEIDNKTARNFTEAASDLISYIKPLAFEFARVSEETFSIQDFEKEISESIDGFFIRFIHYFGDREIGEETANAHADQSGFTLHLFESAPGLQCLTYEKEWMDMPVTEGETIIIPAMQMQLRSNGVLRALAHRVIATEESKDDGRYSAVCFVQFKDTAKYDKDTQGRLQEKEPGFNYEMPIEEFSKLFKY